MFTSKRNNSVFIQEQTGLSKAKLVDPNALKAQPRVNQLILE